jgi:hypothetical protein
MWKKVKLQHKYSKVLFALLEKMLSDDFFKGKIHMNLSKDPPFEVFEEWILRLIDGNPQIGLVGLELHYRVNPLLKLDNLKDVVDGSLRNVNFQKSKFGRIFVVFLTTNSLTEDIDVCSQIDWKSVLSSLLSMKVCFKAIVCICDQKSFNNLVITF